ENLLAALRVEIPYRPNRARRLAADVLLERFRSQQRIPALLLDEAQGFSMPLLEAIRGLMNYECDAFSPFSHVLAGSDEFRQRLCLRPLRRLPGRPQMGLPLTVRRPEATFHCVAHRLRTAGARSELSTRPAVDRLHKGAAGIPRHVTRLATLALMTA